MGDQEQMIDEWASARRDASAPANRDAFTRAVMSEINSSPETQRPTESRPPVLPALPRPLMASLCLAAGTCKVLLVLHLAFS